MGGGGGTPAAPDYTGAANAQGAQNIALLNAQTQANRPNIVTPWGQSTWTYNPPAAPAPAPAGAPAAMGAVGRMIGGVVGRSPALSSAADDGRQTIPGNRNGEAPGAGPQNSGTSPGGWTNTITLTPEQQQALDDQMAIQAGRSHTALGLLDQTQDALGTPMDWSNLHPASEGVNSGTLRGSMEATAGDWRQRGQDAVTELQRPMLEQRRAALETQLSNQGITPGSEAWNNAMRQLGDDESRAGLQAIAAGRDEAGQLFNQDLQSSTFQNQAATQQLMNDLQAGRFDNELRQMGVSEEQIRRGMSLNELNALLSGQQVQQPNFTGAPSSTAGAASAPNLTGALQNSYDAQLNSYNAAQANRQSNINAATNAAMMYALYSFSDKRLKKDIEYLFTLPNGIRIYKYRFIGKINMEIGVIAQEVEKIMPKAVKTDGYGYLMVDYNMVLA